MIDDRVREQAASAQHDIAVIESMIEDQVRPIRERLEHDMAHGNRHARRIARARRKKLDALVRKMRREADHRFNLSLARQVAEHGTSAAVAEEAAAGLAEIFGEAS